jgi:hypothetical protein
MHSIHGNSEFQFYCVSSFLLGRIISTCPISATNTVCYWGQWGRKNASKGQLECCLISTVADRRSIQLQDSRLASKWQMVAFTSLQFHNGWSEKFNTVHSLDLTHSRVSSAVPTVLVKSLKLSMMALFVLCLSISQSLVVKISHARKETTKQKE